MSAPIRSLRCFLFGLLPAYVLAPVVVLYVLFVVVAVPGIFVLFFVLFFVVAVLFAVVADVTATSTSTSTPSSCGSVGLPCSTADASDSDCPGSSQSTPGPSLSSSTLFSTLMLVSVLALSRRFVSTSWSRHSNSATYSATLFEDPSVSLLCSSHVLSPSAKPHPPDPAAPTVLPFPLDPPSKKKTVPLPRSSGARNCYLRSSQKFSASS